MRTSSRCGFAAAMVALLSLIPLATASGTGSGPTCFGKHPTKVGTNGNDLLLGTGGRDVIIGLGGNDRIRSRQGKDFVCAGPGDDVVHGAEGVNYMNGGPG